MLLCNDCKAVCMGKHRSRQSISGANVCPRDCLLVQPWKTLLLSLTHKTNISVSQRANLYLHYWGGCITVKRFSDISLASTDVLMFISAVALVKIEPQWLWGGQQQEVRNLIAHTVSFHANSCRGTPWLRSPRSHSPYSQHHFQGVNMNVSNDTSLLCVQHVCRWTTLSECVFPGFDRMIIFFLLTPWLSVFLNTVHKSSQNSGALDF